MGWDRFSLIKASWPNRGRKTLDVFREWKHMKEKITKINVGKLLKILRTCRYIYTSGIKKPQTLPYFITKMDFSEQ